MLVTKKHLAGIHCASQDSTRYNMNAIHFADDGSIVSTDGHILSRIVPKDMKKRSVFSMTIDSVKDLIKKVQKKGSVAVLNVSDMTSTRVLDAAEFPYELVEDKFPNWRQVHKEPKESEITFEVCFSAHVLESLISSTRQFTGTTKGKDAPIKFSFINNQSPAFVTIEGKDSDDVMEFSVMPMRI